MLPTTSVYGHAGVLLGTPGFGSFYALAGLVLASSFPVVLGFDTEIVGLRSAGMMGARAKQTHDSLQIAKGSLTAEAGEALTLQVDKTQVELSPTEIAMTANAIKLETSGNTLFNFAQGTAQLSGSKILLG